MQETLDEEGRADHRLTQIAEAHVVDDARVEADFAASRRDRALRYAPVDRDRRAEILNDEDETIGEVDGLLVDVGSGRARYGTSRSVIRGSIAMNSIA